MTKRLTTIIVEDDFGRVQTKVEADLFPCELMSLFLKFIEERLYNKKDCECTCNSLNMKDEEIRQLKEENNELKQDNDIKFWKLQCMHYFNSNSLFMSEISRAITKGYKVSDKFQEYLDELKEDNKEIKEKNERLFGDSDD